MSEAVSPGVSTTNPVKGYVFQGLPTTRAGRFSRIKRTEVALPVHARYLAKSIDVTLFHDRAVSTILQRQVFEAAVCAPVHCVPPALVLLIGIWVFEPDHFPHLLVVALGVRHHKPAGVVEPRLGCCCSTRALCSCGCTPVLSFLWRWEVCER